MSEGIKVTVTTKTEHILDRAKLVLLLIKKYSLTPELEFLLEYANWHSENNLMISPHIENRQVIVMHSFSEKSGGKNVFTRETGDRGGDFILNNLPKGNLNFSSGKIFQITYQYYGDSRHNYAKDVPKFIEVTPEMLK